MSNLRFHFVVCACVLACSYAGAQRNERAPLRVSTYLTANSVANFFEENQAQGDPLELLRGLHVDKVILEVYRGGVVVPEAQLMRVRDWFAGNDFEVWGGIATVPGGDFGVEQEGPLSWFNWQAQKTRDDLREVAEMSARVFGTFIVDDFLCTGDVSEISRDAKGERTWAEYRRDLMVDAAREIFIEPMKAINPDITLVVKFPQWYDRFHEFGYDVPRQSAQFDKVWVGTETRGMNTQRFGYVQPYEGFVNYRWIESIAGDKTVGAWFDHGDCDGPDFLDQAYQTVLAGAPEITLFSYAQLRDGHPGHDLFREHWPRLVELSAAVRQNPVVGVPGYKPPNTDPGGDMYLFDYLGMLGIPLIPTARFPKDAPVMLIPAQAAGDPDIMDKINAALARGARVIVTASFLAAADKDGALAERAGLAERVESAPLQVSKISWRWWNTDPEWPFAEWPAVERNDVTSSAELGTALDLEAPMTIDKAVLVLEGEPPIPLLAGRETNPGELFILNTHTFSQADFDAVGEVLLAPRPLGLLNLPPEAVDRVRHIFTAPLQLHLVAPTRVSIQPLDNNAGSVVHNYDSETVRFLLRSDLSNLQDSATVRESEVVQYIELPTRFRSWVQTK